jgi:hypothetical protein
MGAAQTPDWAATSCFVINGLKMTRSWVVQYQIIQQQIELLTSWLIV